MPESISAAAAVPASTTDSTMVKNQVRATDCAPEKTTS